MSGAVCLVWLSTLQILKFVSALLLCLCSFAAKVKLSLWSLRAKETKEACCINFSDF